MICYSAHMDGTKIKEIIHDWLGWTTDKLAWTTDKPAFAILIKSAVILNSVKQSKL